MTETLTPSGLGPLISKVKGARDESDGATRAVDGAACPTPPTRAREVGVRLELDDATLEALADLVAPLLAERLAQPSEQASPYLSVREAADFLRCGRQRVDNLLSAGRLTRHKDGSRTLIERSELERYVAREGR